MISILVFYCPSRKPLFEAAWEVLRPVFRGEDKILCCDGKSNIQPPGFSVVEVKRPGTFYNWAKVWEDGIAAAKHDTILYLDCDRFFDPAYITTALELLDDQSIVYPLATYGCTTTKKDIPQLEFRTPIPPPAGIAPWGKNPLSGNTLLTKQVYNRIGGFDSNFEGYGYADTDFFLRAFKAGVTMKHVPIPEYHLAHGTEADPWEHLLMSLYNCRLLCRKHNLQPTPRVSQAQSFHLISDELIDRYPSLNSFVKAINLVRPLLL